jgi:hypothetical protein
MIPDKITIIEVEYVRPYNSQDKNIWDFRATPDVEYPHGYDCYGGIVRKTAEGWIAEAWEVIGTPQKTRDAAVAAIAIDVFKRGIQLQILQKEEKEKREIEYKEQARIARIKDAGPELLAALKAYSIFSIAVFEKMRATAIDKAEKGESK